MNRASLVIALAASMAATVGCASKNYVKQQTTPLINKTNELDDMTAQNTKAIKDVDARAQAGIQQVNQAAAAADQMAQAAGQGATLALQSADNAVHRVGVLSDAVANLDNYKVVSESSVHFGFDKDFLTKEAKADLDKLGATVPDTKGYIITLEGGTDSTGPADYNYSLSERRANSVIQYLSEKYNVPPHKIYVIGLGKDKPIQDNKTRDGRAANRRVDIRLMSNTAEAGQPSAATPPSM